MTNPDDFRAPMRVASHEAKCAALDLIDAIDAKNVNEAESHLRDAILRHDTMTRKMREALTIVSRRRQVLSMVYPANLGGGHGPE